MNSKVPDRHDLPLAAMGSDNQSPEGRDTLTAGQKQRRFPGSPALRLFALSAVLLIGVFGHAAPEEAVAKEKYNVLFIAADDLRMNLGCYGDEVAVTPHLDRLAGRAMVFERAYCQFPSCNASRSSVITGMRPDSISVWRLNDHFRKTAPDVITLPQHFKSNGYHTESIGKVLHNYYGIRDNELSWSIPARLDQEGHFNDYALKENSRKGKGKSLVAERADAPDEAYVDGRITRDAVETIRRLSQQDEAFFLAVGFMKPHSPYNAPSRFWKLYDREDMQALGPQDRPDNQSDHHWFRFGELRSFPEVPNEGPIPEELAHRLRHGYYAATSFVDSNVGRLLQALEDSGLAENTIVVFWSDHGYHLGENAHWTKVTARELDSQVPLLIHVPGKEPGRTSAIVEYTDLYPTLVDLCRLPAVEGLDGISFAPVLDDPEREARKAALTQVSRPWPDRGAIEQMAYSIRTRDFRFTRWVDFQSGEVLAEELYDHREDVLERSNVAERAEYQVEKEGHARLLDESR